MRATGIHVCSYEKEVLDKERRNPIFTGSITQPPGLSQKITRSLWSCFSICFLFFVSSGVAYL